MRERHNSSALAMELCLSCTKPLICSTMFPLNSLRPRLKRRPLADHIFKCIFFNENVWSLIKISLKFVPKGPINNIPALVQIMAWHRPGNKPLSEPMMVSLLTHICVTRPQWVNCLCHTFIILCMYSLIFEHGFKILVKCMVSKSLWNI